MVTPPKLASRLLEWFIKDDLAEEVLGDLEEKFQITIQQKSAFKAKLNYWYQVLNYLRPFAIKNYWSNSNNYAMFQNYFKIGIRNLIKSKTNAVINISSLAIGIASCIVIFLFIQNEKSFDSFHSKSENIYRIDEVQRFPGTKEQKVALSMAGMGPFMLADFPEVVNYTRVRPLGNKLFELNDKKIIVEKHYLVDSTFLDIFDFELIAGKRETALDEPYTVVLQESTAYKFFRTKEEALGSSITIDGDLMKITGILRDVPENSHLQFEALISLTSITREYPGFNDRWGSNFLNTYLELSPEADVKGLEAKFDDFMIRHMENEKITDVYTVYLQSLSDVHLGSTDIEHDYENHKKFNGEYLDLFAIIGLFILVIASVNFMNLTTARASVRWKEIGVRKAIGAQKKQIFNQFIYESVLLALLALTVAIAINIIFIPLLNNLIGRSISLQYLIGHPQLIGIIIISTFVIGILAGLYPALFMTSFNVVSSLKGNITKGTKSNFRNALVVLQFGLAMAMIVSTLIVTQQINYMRQKDIGFDINQMMLIEMNEEVNKKFETLKTELQKSQFVKGVTASGQRIGNNFHQWGFKYKSDSGVYRITPSNIIVDYDYLDVYGIKIKEGRTFSKDHSKDNGLAFIINQALADELGFEEPVGKEVGHGHYPDDSLGQIIGVTENFNFNSLHHKVNTLAIVVHDNWGYEEMSIKIEGNNMAAAIADIKSIWDKNISDWPFQYSFLDEHFDQMYRSDKQMDSVVKIMAGLAILIACMGMFGLASITIERKVKEVGIRKVLGASFGQVAYLMSKNFIVLILIAFIIVCPMVYYLVEQWLQNFAFHVDINLLFFLIGGFTTIIIALLTISYHALNGYLRNPAETLKYE